MTTPVLFGLVWENPTWWNTVFGAGLGAAFYVLLKTHKYLVKRTFDPRYNNAYLTRFVTGILAGFILSVVIKFIIQKEDHGSAAALISVLPGVVAILGGFSAEAVEQILQRMVEILVAAVRGDGSAQAKAEATLEKAKLAQEKKNELVQVSEKLAELKALINEPQRLSTALDELRARLK